MTPTPSQDGADADLTDVASLFATPQFQWASPECRHSTHPMPKVRALRTLTENEERVKSYLYQLKRFHKPTRAFVTLTAPVPYGSTDGNGPWNGNPRKIIPAGTTMRIVMVSRMGDVGLSENLEADHGYEVRLEWEDDAMSNIRLEP